MVNTKDTIENIKKAILLTNDNIKDVILTEIYSNICDRIFIDEEIFIPKNIDNLIKNNIENLLK